LGGHKTRKKKKEKKYVFESSVKLRSVGSFQHDVSRFFETFKKKKNKEKSGKEPVERLTWRPNISHTVGQPSPHTKTKQQQQQKK
jgi:hypothetical protein